MTANNDKSDSIDSGTRRSFLQLLGATTLLIPAGTLINETAEAIVPATEPTGENQVYSPTEVLMRDHGLLNRLLLVYAECIRRMDAGTELYPDAIADAAKIIRSYIEDYHEKQEEDNLFHKFRESGKLVDLVEVLSKQHKEGRRLNDMTLSLANSGTLQSQSGRKELTEVLRLFIRMYGPHEAREDTILYPAYRSIVEPKDFNALGAYLVFKREEYVKGTGFEGLTQRIAEIEKNLGIYDLSQFTARM